MECGNQFPKVHDTLGPYFKVADVVNAQSRSRMKKARVLPLQPNTLHDFYTM